MKIKEIEISFKFVVACLFIALICIGFGMIYNKLLFSMILFLTTLTIFILLELIGALAKDSGTKNSMDEGKNTQ